LRTAIGERCAGGAAGQRTDEEVVVFTEFSVFLVVALGFVVGWRSVVFLFIVVILEACAALVARHIR
jgi:hypothetical protein